MKTKWNKIIIPLLICMNSPAFAQSGVGPREFIVGGEVVGPKDPIAATTVGIFTPSPDQQSGSLCTGTIIRKNMAITAAHCVSEGGAKPLVVFERNLHKKHPKTVAATAVAVHPRWRKHAGHGMDQGDIALVKFSGGLPRGYRKSSTIGSETEINDGRKVVLAGYGITHAQSHSGSGLLRKTQVGVKKSRKGKSEMILDQSQGSGACHGDSGGPAFVQKRGKLILAGVTNRSYPARAPDDCAHQAVFTKLPSYRSWIREKEKTLQLRSSLHPKTRNRKGKIKSVRVRAPRAHSKRHRKIHE